MPTKSCENCRVSTECIKQLMLYSITLFQVHLTMGSNRSHKLLAVICTNYIDVNPPTIRSWSLQTGLESI